MASISSLPPSARLLSATAITMIMLAQSLFGAGVIVGAMPLPGPDLASAVEEMSRGACPAGIPVRDYAVTAMAVPISYNNWGDLDLHGAIFAPDPDREAILDDVGGKLSAAGMEPLAASLAKMLVAFTSGDSTAIAAAAADTQRAADAALSGEGGRPTARVTPTDLVQPLVLRAHVGDCVRIAVTNALTEPVSLHVHAAITPPDKGSLIMPGETATQLVYIPDWPGMEGAHFLHSHADTRDQTRHGLFGALVAQAKGARWFSTVDGVSSAPTSLDAIIQTDGASDFREFNKFYHDEVELVNWQLEPLPQISPITKEYGVGTKAISLRSEPFYDRFRHHDELYEQGVTARGHDKSQSYGSYTYGDPGTRIQESYVGDPVKFRTINAGPGQPHIHHLHGGGIRWRTSPVAEPSQFADGFYKDNNPVDKAASQRVDTQNINPGESFNIEPEGGSGGVQQSVGDFLYHCHIAEHYLAGMWSFWRVHNVLQPDLAPLPARAGFIQPAVSSLALIGHTYQGHTITKDNLEEWVARMLPARGVPGEEDASVWDWTVRQTNSGPLVFGEPESDIAFPNYPEDAPGRLAPGVRPVLGFDIISGKLAYPHLKPHFGKRPPFAPDHGPAPYLGATASPLQPEGLCPGDARRLRYDLVSMPASVAFNRFDTDNNAELIVRVEDRADIEGGLVDPTSLILRANARDCIDVLFVNDLKETGPKDISEGIHRKTNVHIHLVQFDVQASDGVTTGFNYETTVRPLEGSDRETPYRFPVDINGDGVIDEHDALDLGDPSAPVMTKLAGPLVVDGGVTILPVTRTSPFLDATGAVKVGSMVGVGLGRPGAQTARLLDVDEDARTITLQGALSTAHGAGARVGYEFVRYAWYPDVELGIVYFHDHVNGLDTWRHGLYGSLVVEPEGSRWLDPARSSDEDAPDQPTAPVVDVITADPSDSFREITLHFMDRGCVHDGDCLDKDVPLMPDSIHEPAAFNMRADPLWRRDAVAPFSSTAPLAGGVEAAGDPATPLLRAYLGDPVELRFLYTGQSVSRGAGTFGLAGHRFQAEENLQGSRTTDTMNVAVSSHHNWRLECGAGGCQRQPGDYLYAMTNPDYVERGAWGILRVLGDPVGSLAPLPSNPSPAAAQPMPTPTRFYDVAAIESTIVHNPTQGLSSTMERFVPLASAYRLSASFAAEPPDPLVLRARVGDVIQVNLTNMLPHGREVGLHASLVAAGPAGQGITVGQGPHQTARPGETISYVWVADRELGVVDLVSLADPVHDAARGLYGALVIEPAGSTWSNDIGAAATLTLADGTRVREHVVIFHSEDAQLDSSTMPYLPDVQGRTLVNYGSSPLDHGARADGGNGRASFTGFNSCQTDSGCGPRPLDVRNPFLPFLAGFARPWTPVIDVEQGQGLVLRFVGGAGTQQVAAQVDGHVFAADPDMDDCKRDLSTCRSNLVSTVALGPRDKRDVWIPAAGPGGNGDYVFRNQRDAFFEAGAWGIVRVGAPEVSLPSYGGYGHGHQQKSQG